MPDLVTSMDYLIISYFEDVLQYFPSSFSRCQLLVSKNLFNILNIHSCCLPNFAFGVVKNIFWVQYNSHFFVWFFILFNIF